jgi:hypothetical protein
LTSGKLDAALQLAALICLAFSHKRAAMCDTAERPLRLGWNSRSTNVGDCGARSGRPTGREPSAEAVKAAGDFEHLAHRCSRALPCGPCSCRRGGVSDEPHSKRANRRYRARWLDPDGGELSRSFNPNGEAVRHLAAVEGATCQPRTSATNPVTVGEYAPNGQGRVPPGRPRQRESLP